MPQNQNNEKPPRVGGDIEWVQKGVGWDCREIYYEGKRRRRRHIAHLGRAAYDKLRADSPDSEALRQRLQDWIEARKFEKDLPPVNGQGTEQRQVM